MLDSLVSTYGFQADFLEGDSLSRLFEGAGARPEIQWAARTFRSRARAQQNDSYRLYHLPQLELYALVFEVDGCWVRTFESLPDLNQLAELLCDALTGLTPSSHLAYIPSGSLEPGWQELEGEVRLWWWGRLLQQINHPTPEEKLVCWPQRWADLLQEAAPPSAVE